MRRDDDFWVHQHISGKCGGDSLYSAIGGLFDMYDILRRHNLRPVQHLCLEPIPMSHRQIQMLC